MGFSVFSPQEENDGSEDIRFTGGRVLGHLQIFKFIDKDTNQHEYHSPAFDVTGYGETSNKAEEMFKFSIGEIFDYLVNLSPYKRNREMTQMGWRHITFKNKNYSKSYVDLSGELRNFNAVQDHVEVLTFEPA